MTQLSRKTFVILSILCLLASDIYGQSLNIFNVSVAETRECTWNTHDSGRTVLRGEAYIPPESQYTSFIVFDGRSKTSEYQQLCLINTANCQGRSGFPDCYCEPSDVVNMYTFVVNLTGESMNGKDLIRAYLLAEDSRRLQEVEITLSTLQGNVVAVTTDLIINGESMGENCNKTINSNELIIKAECKNYLTSCWLELGLGETAKPIINSSMISYQNIFDEGSTITLSLRRSICGKDRFEHIKACKIELVQRKELLEADTNDIIIIACVTSLSVLIVIAIVITILLCKRRKRFMNKHPRRSIKDGSKKVEVVSSSNDCKPKEIRIEIGDDQKMPGEDTDEEKALITPKERYGNNSFEYEGERLVDEMLPNKIDPSQTLEIVTSPVHAFEENGSECEAETEGPEKPPHTIYPTQNKEDIQKKLNTELSQCLVPTLDQHLQEEEEENSEYKDFTEESNHLLNTDENSSHSAIRECSIEILKTKFKPVLQELKVTVPLRGKAK